MLPFYIFFCSKQYLHIMAADKKVQPIDLNVFPIDLDDINDRKLAIKRACVHFRFLQRVKSKKEVA